MNASSWPMFLLRTLNGAEMAPAAFFKKVRRKGLLVYVLISIDLWLHFLVKMPRYCLLAAAQEGNCYLKLL